MTTRVVGTYDSASPVAERATRWNLFWGLVPQRDLQTGPDCPSICVFEAKTNMAYILLSTVSLGMAVPVRVRYHCCPIDPEPAEM
ncbi:hypothetical protein [Lewinella sp. JB7]|uniref:hypothetical protein n=1 Tax=Lewinella sp. JB7 TaxID=2962887 RepID=UPI0020C97C49|nr:hypothetical protein [Lewinella sp. JB7]MCP9237697.1 hypothetical protein [Lewinella sp. JB7]